jgi:hypothetical protein
MRTDIIRCETPNCPNVLVLHRDSPPPSCFKWNCPACEDALEQQMVDDMAVRQASDRFTRAHARVQELTGATK